MEKKYESEIQRLKECNKIQGMKHQKFQEVIIKENKVLQEQILVLTQL